MMDGQWIATLALESELYGDPVAAIRHGADAAEVEQARRAVAADPGLREALARVETQRELSALSRARIALAERLVMLAPSADASAVAAGLQALAALALADAKGGEGV